MKKILITGISGQDGSYMVEHCLRALPNALIFGMLRRTAQIHDENFRHLRDNPRLKLVRGDLMDAGSIDSLVQEIKPDYFINLAAQSFVGDSWKIPEETFMATAVGVLRCLEAVRKYAPHCRIYNAGSSEEFGDVLFSPQTMKHPFRPRSPYGAAKCAAHHLIKVYRESYNLYAIQGVLYNHESERRGEEFVTRKITKGFARIDACILNGLPFSPIQLGNIYATRDWSHAADFVKAIWMMLNQDQYNPALKNVPEEQLPKVIKEYVVASGESHSIKEFIDIIIKILEYDATWVGQGIGETLVLNESTVQKYNTKSSVLISVTDEFYRPADVNTLLGCSDEIRTELGWTPSISFDTLVKLMLLSDKRKLDGRGSDDSKKSP